MAVLEFPTAISGARPTALVLFELNAVQSQVRLFLDQLGFRVVEGRSESELLAMAAEQSTRLDLVLSDTAIPAGSRMAEQAIARRPQLRVLLVSTDPEHVGRALTADPRVEFIEKPFSWRELRDRVCSLVETAVACSD